MIYLYDKFNDTLKSSIQPHSCVVHHTENEIPTCEVTADAEIFYNGNIELDDLLLLPFPDIESDAFRGDAFRISKMTTEDGIVTVSARHITADFENAFMTDIPSMTFDLQGMAEGLGTWAVGSYLWNTRDVSIGFYKHDASDPRYSDTHEILLANLSGADVLSHMIAIYDCNVVFFRNKIIFTYGTTSDYIHSIYDVPLFSSVLMNNKNVIGYTTELTKEDLYTAIAVFGNCKYDGEDKQIYCGRVVNTAYQLEHGIEECLRHLVCKNYSPQIEQLEGETEAAFNTRLIADYMAQALYEVNSINPSLVNVSIEAIADDGDVIFGGEVCVCADALTRKEFSIQLISFDYDINKRRYENIQFGRTTKTLADLRR